MKSLSKNAVWLISGCLVVISIVLLLTFFLVKDLKQNSKRILNINCENLTIYKGEVREDYFDINYEGSSISLTVNKEGIIDIDQDRIVGIKGGEVDVLITATLDDMIVKDNFHVTVIDDYQYNIIPVAGCTFDDCLYVNEEVCYFELQTFNRTGDILDNLNFSYYATNNAYIKYELGTFLLIANTNSEIFINYEDIDYSITFKVVVNNI